MRLFRHYDDLPPDVRGPVVALGNFDGVHRGHQVVIAEAAEVARRLSAPLAVMTFEPHPRTLFRPDDPPFRLTPFRIKARQIEALGVDVLFTVHFDEAFSRKPAETFVEEVLVDRLGVRHVVIGHDFVFGHGRGGNVALLRSMAQRLGFGVTEVTSAADEVGGVFSSTRVRALLAAGEPMKAAEILGRPWEIEGRVEVGDRLGRTIGFPTANIGLDDYLRPAFGVYAVRAGVDRGAETVWHEGVANIGRRPTVAGADERLEVHLFDFAEDLYGRHLRVQIVDFIRPERRFDGLEALKAQIGADARAARRILRDVAGAAAAVP